MLIPISLQLLKKNKEKKGFGSRLFPYYDDGGGGVSHAAAVATAVAGIAFAIIFLEKFHSHFSLKCDG